MLLSALFPLLLLLATGTNGAAIKRRDDTSNTGLTTVQGLPVLSEANLALFNATNSTSSQNSTRILRIAQINSPAIVEEDNDDVVEPAPVPEEEYEPTPTIVSEDDEPTPTVVSEVDEPTPTISDVDEPTPTISDHDTQADEEPEPTPTISDHDIDAGSVVDDDNDDPVPSAPDDGPDDKSPENPGTLTPDDPESTPVSSNSTNTTPGTTTPVADNSTTIITTPVVDNTTTTPVADNTTAPITVPSTDNTTAPVTVPTTDNTTTPVTTPVADNTTAPVTVPAVDNTTTTAPVNVTAPVNTTAPVNVTAPIVNTTSPVVNTTAPVVNTTAPVVNVTAPVTPPLPTGWANTGSCISEVSGRALTGSHYSSANMTQASCAAFCGSNGYTLAGLEYASECWCGSILTNGASLAKTSTGCTLKCSGDSTSICGGGNAITLLAVQSALTTLSTNLTSTPITLPAGWNPASSSCISEAKSGRALTGATYASDSMTIGSCLNFCSSKGFSYGGLEYARECYCGNSLVNGASLDQTSGQCSMTCQGDAAHTCGGSNAIQLYFRDPSLPAGWGLASSCIAEGSSGRALASASWSDNSMTNAKCMNYCSGQGFQFAGTEYGRECYCGDSLVNGASLSRTSTSCTKSCGGDSSTICGGGSSLTVFQNPSLALNLQVVNNFKYQGCIKEVTGRALTSNSLVNPSMTIDMCTSFCKTAGYTLAGIEYGSECYCGNSFSNGASASALSTQCNMQCPGNNKQNCGGPSAVALWSL
ncbi:uncharacterized protein L201_003880 [Kwoniella dendrophila CBS 6074]|uniref:WSC domain-containing protein n=1 Tax=Kwoniella dendrophila CBS 6074 TaxID=1295534 RepID=A0AAX4JWS1_9TREE